MTFLWGFAASDGKPESGQFEKFKCCDSVAGCEKEGRGCGCGKARLWEWGCPSLTGFTINLIVLGSSQAFVLGFLASLSFFQNLAEVGLSKGPRPDV